MTAKRLVDTFNICFQMGDAVHDDEMSSEQQQSLLYKYIVSSHTMARVGSHPAQPLPETIESTSAINCSSHEDSAASYRFWIVDMNHLTSWHALKNRCDRATLTIIEPLSSSSRLYSVLLGCFISILLHLKSTCHHVESLSLYHFASLFPSFKKSLEASQAPYLCAPIQIIIVDTRIIHQWRHFHSSVHGTYYVKSPLDIHVLPWLCCQIFHSLMSYDKKIAELRLG